MNNNQEKIETGIPNIYINKPETAITSSIESEIARLEAMHVLGKINLGNENDSFSKIYIDLLEEYEKKYKELPKEPFVRNENEARQILYPENNSQETKIESANTNNNVEKREIKKETSKIEPLSLFEEILSI